MSFLRFVPVLSASLLFTACGSSTGGTVALELTDAPPDLTTLDKVEVTIGAVEVHVAGGKLDNSRSSGHADGKVDGKDDVSGHSNVDGGGTWITVTEHAGTFDLLALQNDVTAPLGNFVLPDGKITQIRLFIDPAGRNAAVLKAGDECLLDITKVSKDGIKINHAFKAIDAPSDGQVRVVVDFDVKESVDQKAECSFSLNPVIKIKKVETKAEKDDADDEVEDTENESE
jgi:hypothetical protein